jgi:probable rRNA maturation factor
MPTTRTNKKSKAAKEPRPNRIWVFVQYAVPRRGVPGAALLRKWAQATSVSTITVRIVGEREGRALNRAFRKKNHATNVLSFPYGKSQGDVVLCHPVIRREARAQGKSLAAHYAHLVVHGCLHLRGYDHEKKRDAARMEAREIAILRRGGIRNPYAIE